MVIWMSNSRREPKRLSLAEAAMSAPEVVTGRLKQANKSSSKAPPAPTLPDRLPRFVIVALSSKNSSSVQRVPETPAHAKRKQHALKSKPR
jgi:hypothetical protein